MDEQNPKIRQGMQYDRVLASIRGMCGDFRVMDTCASRLNNSGNRSPTDIISLESLKTIGIPLDNRFKCEELMSG